MDLSTLLTFGITLAGCCVTFGICKNKIDQNQKDIEALKTQHKDDINLLLQKQGASDLLLQDISKQLTELNTKVSLLIKGKINTGN